jgi:cell division protein FtsB|tara:strand:- start:220 stop:534 length:315 start_codon:yes stop_codon:yes gene_type:complete
MNGVVNLSTRIKKYYPYFFLPLIIIYLSFNIFDGNNGLLSHARLDNEIITLENKINSLKTDNSLMQIKISSLQSLNTSSDLVDEQIRNVLGYGKPNEYIVFFNN